MKLRIFSIVVLLLFVPLIVFAEPVDYASMTTEELNEIQSAVNAELASRQGITPDMIGPGAYIAGKDIKPGRYCFVCVVQPDEKFEVFVGVYKDEEMHTHYTLSYLNLNEEFVFTLNEGMGLSINFGYGKLIPMDNPSWAP